MKKTVVCFALVFILLLCSCEKDTLLSEYFSSLTKDKVLSDNISALNTYSGFCIYGDKIVYIQNTTDGGSVICSDEKIYTSEKTIHSVKAVDNTHICLCFGGETDYYTLLDLRNGATKKVKFAIESKYDIIGAEPYFTENAIYIAALIHIDGEDEPSAAIYKKRTDEKIFTVISEKCAFYQILDCGVLFSENGNDIVFVDDELSRTQYNGFELDGISSIISGKYNVCAVDNKLGVTDIFSGKPICSYDISQDLFAGGIENVYVSDEGIFYLDLNGFNYLDFDTMENRQVYDGKILSYIVANNLLYISCEDKLSGTVVFRTEAFNNGIQPLIEHTLS